MFCKERIAKAIRVLSVPPVMVSVLILILAFSKDGIFRSTLEIVITIVLLGFVPILAYGLQKILPGFKEQGREGQRKLAFITNLVGYSAAFLWALIADVENALLLICSTYLLGVMSISLNDTKVPHSDFSSMTKFFSFRYFCHGPVNPADALYTMNPWIYLNCSKVKSGSLFAISKYLDTFP